MIQAATISNRLRMLVVLTLTIVPFAWAEVSAQEDGSYQAELIDWTIDVTGSDYVLQNVALEEYPHGRGERIYITSVDSAGFAEVSFFDDTDTPEQTIELNLSDFDAASNSLVVLERGAVGDIHYALARFELQQGMNGYFYIEVAQDIEGNIDLSQSLYSLDSDFLAQLELASSEISMAGLAFLQNPVIDLNAIVHADQDSLAATPQPVATPEQGSYTFEFADAVLVVEGAIGFDFPLANRDSDLMFLQSAQGYGVVGFINQDTKSAEVVLNSFFIGAPVGDEAPVELFLESDSVRAFGVYRIATQGEIRAMIIEVIQVSDGLWQVEAMAVTEAEFESSLIDYQSGVSLNGEPLLGNIEASEIVTILNSSN